MEQQRDELEQANEGHLRRREDRENSHENHWQKKTVLDCMGWLSREQAKGHNSPPNSHEFLDINEFAAARNLWRERGANDFPHDKTVVCVRSFESTHTEEAGAQGERERLTDVLMIDSGEEGEIHGEGKDDHGRITES